MNTEGRKLRRQCNWFREGLLGRWRKPHRPSMRIKLPEGRLREWAVSRVTRAVILVARPIQVKVLAVSVWRPRTSMPWKLPVAVMAEVSLNSGS